MRRMLHVIEKPLRHGQPKVSQSCYSFTVTFCRSVEHVLGLDISVDDAAGVECTKAAQESGSYGAKEIDAARVLSIVGIVEKVGAVKRNGRAVSNSLICTSTTHLLHMIKHHGQLPALPTSNNPKHATRKNEVLGIIRTSTHRLDNLIGHHHVVTDMHERIHAQEFDGK